MMLSVFFSLLTLGVLSCVSAQTAATEGYVLAYFTNNTVAGEKIYLAASNGNNALDWTELHGGQPVLASTKGTTGLRDPFLMRSHQGDRFFLLATDLSIGSGTSWGDSVKTGSRYLEVWESADLQTWSEQRHVLVSPAEAGNTWAPEAYYDPEISEYVVFWASSLYGNDDPNHTGATYHRMMYATTKDFVTFSSPSVWQDAGTSRIDSTVIKAGNDFYRFTKDEGAATGCADIIQERSSSLLATLDKWTTVASCIGKNAGLGAVEGPTVFKSNAADVRGEKFYLFVDEYSGKGYIPLETADISKPEWKVSAEYKLPTSPRHGTVVPVTAAELARVKGSAKTTVRRRHSDRVSAQAESGNPILPDFYADPNIAVFNCTYYIYATTDGFPGWGGQEFYVWQSPDLTSWSRSTSPFLTLNGTSGTVPWASGNAWAPTIIEHGGSYYFYFSGHNTELDRKTIGVATSPSPEGPFTAQPRAMILNDEAVKSGQAIDPDVFLDPQTGKYWLAWGNGNPVMAELSDDMLSIKPDTLHEPAGLVEFREGSFIHFRKGLYHFTYSIDDTGSENYRVGYATATSMAGPWAYHGVLLEKDASQGILATGHSSILNVPGTDDWYIVYHRFAIPGGDGTHRVTCIDRMTFDAETGLAQRVKPTLSGIDPQPVAQK